VSGQLGRQGYALWGGSAIARKARETDLPLSLSLGVLGLNGIAAYFGFHNVFSTASKPAPTRSRRDSQQAARSAALRLRSGNR
jgi:NADPH-dependent curcumin reductase CurA